MPSINEAADELLAADLPIIFLDTCILLDVVRAVKRQNKDCVASAKALRDAAKAVPAKCRPVASFLVSQEWREHHPRLVAEAAKHLDDLQFQSRHFHEACGILRVDPGFPRANYAGCKIAEQLGELSGSLLESSLELNPDADCREKAYNRAVNKIPPSIRGGEVKDSTILEAYLAICRILLSAGFKRKLVFCTSNTNDYCESGGLHHVLASEFASVNLHFTTNLPWGFQEVTH